MDLKTRTLRLAGSTSLAFVLMITTTVLAFAQGRDSGTVQAVNGNAVTIDDGTTFTLASDARVVVSHAATTADLTTGQYVAITASRLDDGLLLASIVSVFPDSQRGSFGGQFFQSD